MTLFILSLFLSWKKYNRVVLMSDLWFLVFHTLFLNHSTIQRNIIDLVLEVKILIFIDFGLFFILWFLSDLRIVFMGKNFMILENLSLKIIFLKRPFLILGEKISNVFSKIIDQIFIQSVLFYEWPGNVSGILKSFTLNFMRNTIDFDVYIESYITLFHWL